LLACGLLLWLAYGLHHQQETGNVVFQLRVDPIFTILPPNDGSYTISADGVAIRPIESIAPNGGTFSISVHVLMKGEAGLRLYESVPWMAELYLRDRCIEYWTRPIRITPVFLPGGNSDVVLVTCAEVDRREFLAWSYLVQLLGELILFSVILLYHPAHHHQRFFSTLIFFESSHSVTHCEPLRAIASLLLQSNRFIGQLLGY
jgi:hypothetical protein